MKQREVGTVMVGVMVALNVVGIMGALIFLIIRGML